MGWGGTSVHRVRALRARQRDGEERRRSVDRSDAVWTDCGAGIARAVAARGIP